MNYKKQNMANEDNYSGTQAHLATSIVEANGNASLTGNPVQQSLARRLIIAPIKEKKEKLNAILRD